MGVARNGGFGFIMGDWKFLKSFYIVGRGVLTPLFYENPLYCLFVLFQILSTPSPTSLSPPIPTSNPHLHCSFCFNVSLPEWVMGWSYHIWCAILLNDNVDLHMSSLGSLVPEGPWYVCFMQQDIKFAEV